MYTYKLSLLINLIIVSISLIEYVPAQEIKLSADSLFNKGYALFTEGHYENAIEYFNQTLELDSKFKLAWFYKGISYQENGKYDLELQCYEKFIEIDPGDAVVWQNKAIVLIKLGKFSIGEESFKKAEKLNPKDPWIFFNRGYYMFNNGDYEKAINDLKHAKTLKMQEHREYIDRYILWSNRLLRQLSGSGLPPKDWKPNYELFHTNYETTSKENPLIDMPEYNRKRKSYSC